MEPKIGPFQYSYLLFYVLHFILWETISGLVLRFGIFVKFCIFIAFDKDIYLFHGSQD